MGGQEKVISSESPPACSFRKTGLQDSSQDSVSAIEILVEGQECPFCNFAKLKRDGDEIVCPICGYGRKPCT
jgi:uncharacterized Zn finger protein (UPF0148 family)